MVICGQWVICLVFWQKDEGQRRGRNEEANRYLDEGEHSDKVVEEEPGLDWCLLCSPQATFIQKSGRGMGGEFSLIRNPG